MSSDVSINRELSWLELNRRFLKDAQDPTLPLLERVKRLATFSANLDKFFMVRVAELRRASAAETLAAVVTRIHELVDEQQRCFLDEIQPLLASEGIFLLRPKEAAKDQQRFIGTYFRKSLLPVLTPLAIDSGKPFPHLGNCSLSLVVSIRPSKSSVLPHATLSVIHIPRRVLPSFIALPVSAGTHAFMLLQDVIRLYLPSIYSGYDIVSSHAIRTTRETDAPLPRGAKDAAGGSKTRLREPRLGAAVRLQHDGDPPPEVLIRLLSELDLSPADLFEGEGFGAFCDLLALYAAIDLPRLKDASPAPFVPQAVAARDSDT